MNKYRNALLGVANLAQAALAQQRGPGRPSNAVRQARPAQGSGRFTWPSAPASMSHLSSASHLGNVAARVLNIEKLLFPLLEGQWASAGEQYRKQWAQTVVSSRRPWGVAKAVMQLEECLRPVAINEPDNWFTQPEPRKVTQIEDTRMLVLEDNNTVGRSNATARRRPADQAQLPRVAARPLARKGGRALMPNWLIYYSGRGHTTLGFPWSRRLLRVAWLADTEMAKTTAALAVQARASGERLSLLRCCGTLLVFLGERASPRFSAAQ